jgi:hypothetical protein
MPRKEPSLHFFDFDDTLFETDNTVGIKVPGQPRIELNSHEFAYIEKHHELPRRGLSKEDIQNSELFFDNFERVINPRPIKKNLAIFRNILLRNPRNLFILTARGGGTNQADIKETIDNYFADILPNTGFDVGHIITRDQQQHLRGETSEKKKQSIEEMMDFKKNPKIHFLDDAIKNVEKVGEIPWSRSRLVKKDNEEAEDFTQNKMARVNMPRKNVPQRVDEIADAILGKMKKSDNKMSEEKMYDIAYGTAWKTYYKENPDARDKQSSSDSLLNIKIAQFLDGLGLYKLADVLGSGGTVSPARTVYKNNISPERYMRGLAEHTRN